MTPARRLNLRSRLRRFGPAVRRRSAGVRVRLALTYTLAAFLLAVAGGALFTVALRHGLRTNVDAELAARAGQVSAAVTASARSGTPSLAGAGSSGRDVTVLLRPDGSRAAPATVPDGIALPADAAERARSGPVHLATDRDGRRYRFLAEPVRLPDGTWTVLVGADLSLAEDVADDTAHYLVIVAPVLLVAVGAFAWLLSGSALRPVDRMRADAAGLARRLDTASPAGATDPPHPPSVSVPATADEVQALAETLNDLLARLDLSLSQQRALVADAGHELRTPLATLSMELELASRPGRDAAQLREAVQHAAGEVDRLIRLANSLLWLAGPPSPRRAPTSLTAVVEQSVRARRALAAAAGIRVETTVPDAAVGDLDELAVRQAVDNLLANALAAAPLGSLVRVTVTASEHELVLSVDDDGPGVPETFLPHAFDRFRRADDARVSDPPPDPGPGGDVAGGSGGLGLAVVAAVAERHGGRAELTNRPGGGARARLVLPRRSRPE